MDNCKYLLEQVIKNPFDKSTINSARNCGDLAVAAAIMVGLDELKKSGSPGGEYAGGLTAMLKGAPGMGGLDAYLRVSDIYKDIVQKK